MSRGKRFSPLDDSLFLTICRCLAGEEFFSRDDVQRVVGMLHIGSETLEWDSASERDPGAERYPGTGPYDTGAV